MRQVWRVRRGERGVRRSERDNRNSCFNTRVRIGIVSGTGTGSETGTEVIYTWYPKSM